MNSFERDIGEYFANAEEFWASFKTFDALNPDWERWQRTTAAKEHEDIFGDTVESGEVYFKKHVGPAFDAVEKVSLRSMVRMVYLMLVRNPRLQSVGEEFEAREFDRMRAAADSLESGAWKP